MYAHSSDSLTSLSVALLFAAIFLWGGRAAYWFGQDARRRFLSFAAGISVSYTFVKVLPALGAIQDLHVAQPTGFYQVFPAYSVYLWTMTGFLVFYGLETLAAAEPRHGTADGTVEESEGSAWRPWVHIGGFALYAWLITFMIVWTGKGVFTLWLFAAAMGIHFFPIAYNLRSHYRAVYDRHGALLLALATLGGWVCGQALSIPRPIVFNLLAIVAGGVIVNAVIAELPKKRESAYWSFVTGAVLYTALLLFLSHVEKGE